MIEKIGKFSGGSKKTVSVGAEMTSSGRLFQRRLLATGNARSSTLDSRVCRITSCEDDDHRRQWWLEWQIIQILTALTCKLKFWYTGTVS